MTATYPIGDYRNVVLDVAAWDGVGAEVDLSAICLFSREPAGKSLVGGARHADAALDGALTRLRAKLVFTAEAGETVLLQPGAGKIEARHLLVIGLGDPDSWTVTVTARAAGLAAQRALEIGAGSVAFAPSLLDSGMSGEGTAEPMMSSVLRAIDRSATLAEEGLWPAPVLRRFTFDAGEAHASGAAEAFRTALLSARPVDVTPTIETP